MGAIKCVLRPAAVRTTSTIGSPSHPVSASLLDVAAVHDVSFSAVLCYVFRFASLCCCCRCCCCVPLLTAPCSVAAPLPAAGSILLKTCLLLIKSPPLYHPSRPSQAEESRVKRVLPCIPNRCWFDRQAHRETARLCVDVKHTSPEEEGF